MKKQVLQIGVICVFAVGLYGTVHARELSKATPESVGLSSERLERINTYMEDQIAKGELVGAVTVVLRHGKIAHIGTHGFADREKKVPMRADTIFRLASASKIISAVGAMIAWEEGYFQLQDLASKWIPELKKENLSVLELNPTDPMKFKTVPAKNEITVLDSLTMTSGLPYPGFLSKIPKDSPAWAAWYAKPELGYYSVNSDMTLEKYFQIASKLPLINQPGEEFNYGPDLHIVARIIEVVSGKTFHDYLDEKLWKPLGMKDTGFYLPKEKGPRFAALYEMTQEGLVRIPEGKVTERLGTKWQADLPYAYGPIKYQGPGENINSTPIDYARMLQMLLNGGKLDGVQILSRKTVEMMTSDHIGEMCCTQRLGNLGRNTQWGLGMGVVGKRRGSVHSMSPGSFYWSAYTSNYWFVDPKEELVGIIMSQRVPMLATPYYLWQFDNLVYQAIVD